MGGRIFCTHWVSILYKDSFVLNFKFFDKAQERLEEFINSSGLFILASHSEEILKKFCTRGIVLKKGALVFDGNLLDAIKFYHEEQ